MKTIEYPSSILAQAVIVYTTEFAWRPPIAVWLIAWYKHHEYIILGGDVYEWDDNDYMPTGNNWFVPKDTLLNNTINEACDLAYAKVSFYTSLYQDRNIVFVFVVTTVDSLSMFS